MASWAIGVLLVTLSALISIRPSLAMISTGAFDVEDTIRSLPLERTFSSDLLPWSSIADDPSKSDQRPVPEHALLATGHDFETPTRLDSLSGTRSRARVAPRTWAHAPRGPPRDVVSTTIL